MLDWFKSYLSQREQFVNVNGHNSLSLPSHKFYNMYRWHFKLSNRNIPQQNKMVKPQSGFSSTPPTKEEKHFVRFVLTILRWSIFVIYYSKVDTKLPTITITSKHVERNRLNFSLGKVSATDWSSISHESTQVINYNYLVKLRISQLH